MSSEERTLFGGFPPLRRLPALLSAAFIALGAAGLAACGGDDESPAPETGGGGAGQVTEDGGGEEAAGGEAAGEVPPGAEVTVDDLVANPTDYYGEQVTVSGEVGQVVVSPGAFTLGASVEGGDAGVGDEAVGEGAGGTQSILVLPTATAQVPDEDITESDVVRVQGTVQQITAAIAEEEDFLFEEDAADAGFLQDYTDQVGIVATVIDATVPQENQGG